MLKWTDELSVGVDEIDNQHKELISRVAGLLSAMAKGKGKDEVTETLDFLADYVVFHFSSEERIMREHAYPGFTHHRQQHLFFTERVKGLRDRLAQEGPSSSLAIQSQRLLSDWLVNHISVIDSALGAFLIDAKR
ncbi:MAG: hemerythrin family protein [Firmicutes bacterium]|jgi:hemerythrin|nr:hemerythrin family protein [Candidatus Fermentithermobacillaceae bacterium]